MWNSKNRTGCVKIFMKSGKSDVKAVKIKSKSVWENCLITIACGCYHDSTVITDNASKKTINRFLGVFPGLDVFVCTLINVSNTLLRQMNQVVFLENRLQCLFNDFP